MPEHQVKAQVVAASARRPDSDQESVVGSSRIVSSKCAIADNLKSSKSAGRGRSGQRRETIRDVSISVDVQVRAATAADWPVAPEAGEWMDG